MSNNDHLRLVSDVVGDDKQANVRANNPDAICMLKPGAADVHYFLTNLWLATKFSVASASKFPKC